MIKNIKFILQKNPFYYLESNFIENTMIFTKNNHISLSEYNKKMYKLLIKNKNHKNFTYFFKIWEQIFDEKIILKKYELSKMTDIGVHNLKFYDLIIIDIVSYVLFTDQEDLYIPISSSFLQYNDPLAIYFILERANEIINKNILIVTNDLYWANIFTDKIYSKNRLKKIPILDFYWVESELDLFTYKIFFPEKKFKKAGSSSNIFRIIEKNPSHKSIVDKDGFSVKNISYLKEKFDLYFTNMIECENIWLQSDFLEKINTISPKKINIENFKSEIILRAYKNLEQIILRLKNRQDYLMYNYIPYLNDEEIEKYKLKCIDDLKSKNYNEILKWFDNKKLFQFYLKEAGFDDLKSWKNAVIKNKELFLYCEEEIIL